LDAIEKEKHHKMIITTGHDGYMKFWKKDGSLNSTTDLQSLEKEPTVFDSPEGDTLFNYSIICSTVC